MRKFIPLSTFKELFSNQADLISAEGINDFKRKLEDSGSLISRQAGFTEEDFIDFQDTLNDRTSIVYYGWIEQQNGLINALLGRTFVGYEDKQKHLEHTLSDGYKKFISPCLAEALLVSRIKNDEELKVAFSFVQLLDTDHRAVVESKLYRSIGDRLKEARATVKGSEDEQVLINTVKPLCTDAIIASVNYLSRASYSLRLEYIDQMLEFIRARSCTARFANWILKRMEEVYVHKEHARKIVDLQKELSRGDLKVRNRAKGRTPIRWKTIGTTVFVLGTLGLVFWILYFQPFSDPEVDDFADNTSFKEFSKDERKRIDSLLQEMDHKFDLREIEIDPMNPFNNSGASLTLRKAFENPIMERVYEDLCLDSDIKDLYPIDSCQSSDNILQFKRVGSVKDLRRKVGKHDAVIKNESDYDIILYVSENISSGSVYSILIPSGETEEFNISIFNTIFIVAGTDYQPFEAPNGALADDIPSDKFTHHFCTTDENYTETINTAYKFTRPRNGVTKFMVKGSRSGYIHLIDIHQSLAEY